MAYDLEEQEQLAAMQAFWNKYGNMLMVLLIIAAGSYAGYTWWKRAERVNAAEASALYTQIQAAATAKDNAKVQRIAGDVRTKYAKSAYASMTALTAAKSAFDANDLKSAKVHLQWVADNGNDEYKSIAKLRLAGVLLDEKAYDDGLKLLATPFLPQFAGAVADRKGDILVAQNKLAEARTAYAAALAAMDAKHPGRALVQIKLESIGGTVPDTKAAA